MKTAFSLVVSALLLCGAAFAQTTYSIVGGPYTDGYYPPYLYSFSIQLQGTGNSIGWVTGSLNDEWACGNGNPSTGGFIDKTINNVAQPCANSTSYVVSGSLTVNGCTGPAQAVENFDDNSTVTVFFSYVKGGRWHNICEGVIVGGSLTTPN
jgi:hypothetical protein